MGKPARTPPHFERFRRLIRRVGVPERHAEDLAQEALLRDWEARGGLDPGVDPAPYSVTIALNLARRHLRDASRRGEVLTPFDEHDFRGDQPSPEALLRREQREAVMRDLIEEVDPKYRDLLVKHELEEKSLAEIAAELGLKLDTVRSQHRRAREQLDEAKRRWMAQQEFRGWDKVPCVPVAFGLFRRSWWTTALHLQKVGAKVFAQAALVVLTGAVVATAPRSSSSTSTTPRLRRAAIHAGAATPPQQHTTPPLDHPDARRAVAAASPPVQGSIPAPGENAPAAMNGKPASPAATAARSSPPVRAVRTVASEREKDLILQARKAVEAYNARADVEARRLLDMHAMEFPRGQLAREREALLLQLR
ncbi:ECF-family RNA polymerase sigma factor [Sorangium cellulosum So ce56]|uniref:ECF-family RNA polymerase sigma factor n=1 Tax=Sorangium cellulosum (strain So ce56) TaxID=448385 RepID=A9FUQ6_SORC5|nr:sigma-70 family RNA polymerase sigma factor [Sorangium cellulosum]CAN98657.1 ECF-family RNA polymerase sigma factor [Sorangium cellulosum So ce56]